MLCLVNDVSDLPRRNVLQRLCRDPQALITAAIIGAYVVVAIGAPFFAPHDPNAASLSAVDAPIGTPGYPLGCDGSGRDILSRLIFKAKRG